MCYDIFGTLCPKDVGEAVLDGEVDIPDNEINTLIGGIQKKKIQLPPEKT